MPQRVERYTYGRLCFRRDVIERLGMDDAFEVRTPVGTFRMTRQEFEDAFPHILDTRSWAKGIYHYPRVPSKAEAFRV